MTNRFYLQNPLIINIGISKYNNNINIKAINNNNEIIEHLYLNKCKYINYYNIYDFNHNQNNCYNDDKMIKEFLYYINNILIQTKRNYDAIILYISSLIKYNKN